MDSPLREPYKRCLDLLNDAAFQLITMQSAQHGSIFARDFRTVLSSLRTAENRLERDYASQVKAAGPQARKEFKRWWKDRHPYPEPGELLRWLIDLRDNATHVGEDPIVWQMNSATLVTTDLAPPPDAYYGLESRSDGHWHVKFGGTPHEIRVPAFILAGTATEADTQFSAWVADPPRTHLGRPLPDTDVGSYVVMAIDYWRMEIIQIHARWGDVGRATMPT